MVTSLPMRCKDISNSEMTLGLYSLSGQTSCHKISWSLEAASSGLAYSNRSEIGHAGTVAALPNFKAKRSLWYPILLLGDFTKFGSKTSYPQWIEALPNGALPHRLNDNCWQTQTKTRHIYKLHCSVTELRLISRKLGTGVGNWQHQCKIYILVSMKLWKEECDYMDRWTANMPDILRSITVTS